MPKPVKQYTDQLNKRLQGLTAPMHGLQQRERQHTHMPIAEARTLINDAISAAEQVFTQNQQLVAELEALAALWADKEPDNATVADAARAMLTRMKLLE